MDFSEDAQQNTPLLDTSLGNTRGNSKENMKGNTKKSAKDKRTERKGKSVWIQNAQDCISIDKSWNDDQQNTPLLDVSPGTTQGNTKGSMKRNTTKSTKDNKTRGFILFA